MSTHAHYSPSGAHRWMACPGALVVTEGGSTPGNVFSREGTAGHTLAEKCLRDGSDPFLEVGKEYEVEGHQVPITEELAEGVEVYLDYLATFEGELRVEQKIYYGWVLGLDDDEAFGTSDASVYHGATLHMFDLKLGRSFVSAWQNPQLLLYACGEAEALRLIGEPVEKVVLHIVQPRVSAKPTPYELTIEELEKFQDKARAAVKENEEAREQYSKMPFDKWAKKYLVAGESQCQWCPFKAKCPRMLDEFEAIPDDVDPHELPAEAFAEILQRQPLVEMFLKAVNEEVMGRLTKGDSIPGYKLVRGRQGNRRWGDEDSVVQALAKYPPEKTHQPAKLKTPAQMEKALKEEKDLIESLVVRNPAKPTLAPEDDPRPVWTEVASADEFESH